MRYTATIAALLVVALLNVGGGKAAAASLATTSQSDFISKVLLATTGQVVMSSKDTTSTKDTAKTTSAAASQSAVPTTPAPVLVVVQTGDTLSSIAESQNSTWRRIYNANESVIDPNVINPGQQLRIPTPEESLTDRVLPSVAAAVPSATSPQASTASAVQVASYPVSGDSAKAFIYSHESGNNPNATNASGCYGLGQDCNGRVRALCGADYSCQDVFFTNYAMGRYGSWEAAQAFWLTHHWW